MRINVYPFTCAQAGLPILSSFIDSLHQHDVKIHNTLVLDQCDVAVIWSMLWTNMNRKLIYQHYRALGIPVIILEVGALARNNLWKVGINGINGSANFGNETYDSLRANTLGLQLKPWREKGQHIVLCGQNQQSGEWKLGQMEYYLELTVAKLRRHTNRKIIVRPHPRTRLRSLNLHQYPNVVVENPEFSGVQDHFNFLDALDGAWAVVSHNSNPGIEATIAGIPVFCDSTSLAASVGNLDLADIENPKLVDRQPWLERLAFTEWSQTEIEIGIPWDRLQRVLPCT